MAERKPKSATDMRLVVPLALMTAVGALGAVGAVALNGYAMERRISVREADLVQVALADTLERKAEALRANSKADASGPDYVLTVGKTGAISVTAAAGAKPLGARGLASAKGVLSRLGRTGAPTSPPVVVRLNGEPYLAASAGSGGVLLERLDSAFFTAFAKRHQLPPLTVESGRLKDDVRRNQVSLSSANDYSQGGLIWSVEHRLRYGLTHQAPLGVALGLMIAAGGLFAYRRTRRLAQSLVSSEAHAQHLALHDPLTGLANRALLANRLELAIEQRRRTGGLVAVFAVDLDRFKHVNDSLGHQAGDELIRETGRRLLGVCRATDTVARLGGDEFAVVAAFPDMEAVTSMITRTTAALSGQIALPGGTAELKGSVGVTIIQDDQTDAPEAMRRADLAMYKAKEQGRGRHAIFEPEMDESLRLRRQTETELRLALINGDLELHYQPQFMARSGKLESVEALVRWNHAERGQVSPAYFIPIAEECGLIDQLGEMVMRKACTDARRWPHLKVAINISPIQLRRAGFVKTCERILADTGTEASQIELEITEGVLLENDDRTQTCLRQLRALGFKLALDDFGTGYSSLSYLNAYPVDKIKIDRSFISQLGVQEDADKVIRAIVRLGKALGLQVTAEGVETEAQRAELVSAGCNVLQGFLGGRPGDASTIDALVQAEKSGARAA